MNTLEKIDGVLFADFPNWVERLEKAHPIYEELPGWTEDISGVQSYADLPDNCRKYVDRLSELVEVDVTVVSNGATRDDWITRRESSMLGA